MFTSFEEIAHYAIYVITIPALVGFAGVAVKYAVMAV